MDLSKAFDAINLKLLAKLHEYCSNKDAFKTIHNYPKNRYQRTKISNVFSSWSEILSVFPQGYFHGPLLSNIYLKDMMYLAEKTDICNFADDTTFYARGSSSDILVKRL